MATTIKLSPENYAKFTSAISLLENICNDCDIVDGQIRQFSNDKHVIFNFDITSIFEKNEFCLTVIKQKVNLLSIFEHTDKNAPKTDIEISIDDDKYTVTDGVAQVVFKKPIKKFVDNSYLTDEEYNSRIDLTNKTPMFAVKIEPYMLKRIKLAKDVYSTDKVYCVIKDGVAEIKLKQSDEKTTIIKNISATNIPDAEYDVSSIPFSFIMNNSMTFSMFDIDRDRGLCICQFETEYEGIPIRMYSKVMNAES